MDQNESPDAGSGTVEQPVSLAIQMLGGWEVRLHGRPLPPLRPRNLRWLLALLVLQRGRAVERDWLAGTLWPDNPDTQARFYLRRQLMDLRRTLGPEATRIQSPTPESLRLDLTGAHADVTTFDEAVARGDAAALEEAVRLYRGPLLPDCTEQWVVPERASREQAYLRCLETLAQEAGKQHD